MKKLFFIIIIFFLSLNLFSQNSQDEEFYNLQISDKLNFIYINMFDKHIKDFKKLEDKIKDQESELYKLKSGNLNQKNKELLNNIKEKDILLTELQNELVSTNRLLNESKNSNNIMSNSISRLETQIKNEIRLITNFEGMIDPDLIRFVESKARDNRIPTKDLSKLISLNKEIIKAENILSNPINEINADNQYISLESFRSLPTDWHKYKISSLKQLLSNYCSITSEISKAFSFLDDLGLDEHIRSTKDDIDNRRMLVINYPFLAKELDKKINNIKYVSKVTDCN